MQNNKSITELSSDPKFCENCGSKLDANQKFCENCGAKINKTFEDIKEDKKTEEIKTEETKILKQTDEDKKTDDIKVSTDLGKNINPEKKSKDKKTLIYILIGVVLLAAIIFGYNMISRANNYKEGSELLNQKKYVEATEVFEKLGDYKNSKTLLKEAYNGIDYEKALKVYNDGSYYDARQLFLELNGYSDSKAKADACIKPNPGTKQLYRNPSFAATTCKISIKTTTTAGINTYLKIYSNDTLVSTVFIMSGNTTTISLPVGSYKIRVATGKNWYGDKDMFGPTAQSEDLSVGYAELKNGQSSIFTMKKNYKYTLTLGSVKNGNVGNERVDKDKF